MTIYHRKLLPFWISLALLSQQAGAMGMGQIHLQSHLGEPLQAEVLLNKQSAANENNLVVTLGSPADYDALGVEFSYLHSQLTIEPFTRNGQDYLRISTREPVTEPYLDFVLNMRSPQGQVMREFTVLLDPPDAAAERAPAVAQASAVEPDSHVGYGRVAAPAEQPRPEPVRVTKKPLAQAVQHHNATLAAAPAQPAVKADSSAGYTVKTGDCLWKIADELRPASVSREQEMAALVALNPHAFVNGNPDRLVASAHLAIPASDVQPEVAGATESTISMPASTTAAAAATATAEHQQLDLSAENAVLRAQVSSLNATVADLDQRLASTTQAIQDLSAQFAKLQQQNAELQAAAPAATAPATTPAPVAPAKAHEPSSMAALVTGLPAAMGKGDMHPVSAAGASWWGSFAYWLGIVGVTGWVARNYLNWSRRSAAVANHSQQAAKVERLVAPMEQPKIEPKLRDKQPLRRAEPVVAMSHEPANFNLPVSSEPEQEPDLPHEVDDPVDAAVTAGLFVAFGRYDEAEELLHYALNKNPERVELKLLLLNVFLQTHRLYNYRSLEQEIMASEMTDEEQTKLAAIQENYHIHHG